MCTQEVFVRSKNDQEHPSLSLPVGVLHMARRLFSSYIKDRKGGGAVIRSKVGVQTLVSSRRFSQASAARTSVFER
jgi:hypothetical protein